MLAHRLGLPVKIVCCTVTDSLPKFLDTGAMKPGEVVPSLVPAMDIQNPYNLERALYLAMDGDGAYVADRMRHFTETGQLEVTELVVSKIRPYVSCQRVANEKIKATIRQCYTSNDYLVCPHTATALACATAMTTTNEPVLCFATAAPLKFTTTILESGLRDVAEKLDSDTRLAKLSSLPTKLTKLDRKESLALTLRSWEQVARERISAITRARVMFLHEDVPLSS